MNALDYKKIISILVFFIFVFLFWVFFLNSQRDSEDILRSATTSVSLLKLSDLKSNGTRISVTGQVESSNQANLSAEVGGVVNGVNVSIGQNVSEGEILAFFDTADSRLSLIEAEAGLLAQQSRLDEMKSGALEGEILKLESALELAEINLEKTKTETENAVENARKALLNNDLRAYLANERVFLGDYHNLQPPIISGNYRGEGEVEYKITLYQSGAQFGYSFWFEGPEGRGPGSVDTRVPQQLGNNGLYITFPENFARAEWVIPIPNKRGIGYLSAKNAYKNAKDVRDFSIRQAEENLRQRKEDLRMALLGSRQEQIVFQEAQVKQAAARVEVARSQINKRQIRAPFAGTISKVFVRPGEGVNPGQQVFSLVNEKLLNINAKVSPNNARMMSVDDFVLVNEKYSGVIKAMSGILDSQTGQVEVQIKVEDLENNLFVGEYVQSDVFVEGFSNSVLLPLSAVDVSSAGEFVFVVEEGRAKRIPVSLGRIEGDMINIEKGLEDVDFVIENAFSVRAGQNVEVKD